jgi:calcineurin-like phosphoesterase family protein
LYKQFLNGRIALIKGNHDRTKFDKDFDEVYNCLELKIGQYNCLLTHRPQVNPSYDFIICGHVHEKWLIKDNNINVGVDQWIFTPVSLDSLDCFLNIKKIMEKT